MKKSLIIAIIALSCGTFAYAQPRAIGVNLGFSDGISYEHSLGEKNMLDIAVSIPFLTWGVGAHVTYDWIDPFNAVFPWEEQGEWHWYMGVGGAGGIYGFGAPGWYAGVAGHVGFEYDFWFPLQLSIDWRPSFGVTTWDYAANSRGNGVRFNGGGLYHGLSLGVRYLFNQKDCRRAH